MQYWESNLRCPSCKGKIKIIESSIHCEECHSTFSMAHGVPCFVDHVLSEHQKSDLESVRKGLAKGRSTARLLGADARCYKWATEWVNESTVHESTRVICVGGSFIDDLPHVTSSFKFNVDHLVHEFIKIIPEMVNTNVKHIASTSEALPFMDAYADFVYSRNSLDHVSNPIKTLIEINRVLKPEGRFLLSVYYNSSFIYSGETTVIDDDFVRNHLGNLFDVEWLEVRLSESESVPQPPKFSLPNGNGLGWLYAVCKKNEDFRPYDCEAMKGYERLTSSFHSAVYYDEKGMRRDASRFFAEVIDSKPLLKSDEMRIMYSKIRYLSANDHKGFRDLFDDFKLTNKDPFWWGIVIESSWSFMKDELQKEIDARFSGTERAYLDRTIRGMKTRRIKDLVRRNRPIYRIVEPIYSFSKRV